MEIAIKLILAILGIALYTTFKAREFIFSKEKPFRSDIFFNDNVKSWIWAFLVIAIVLTIISIEPEASEAIKAFTGLDLENTPIGFLTLGIGLTALTRNTTD